MRQVRSTRLLLSLVTAVLVVASVQQMDAEVIFFANGRTMAVKNHHISGETITVTLRHGGQATFPKALIARIAPDEFPVFDEHVTPAVAEASGAPAPALESRPFAALIATVANNHGIDPELVHAVVEAESNYRPTAQSQMGARGLMQVMPATARELGVTSARLLFDPEQNVEAGVKYLKLLLARFDGNLTNAIAAYNAGPAAVLRYGGVPPFRETQAYVRKVLSLFRRY